MIQPDPKIDVSEAAKVTLGGREWLVPVLPLRQTMKMVTLSQRLKGMDPTALTDDQLEAAAAIIHTALTRAYPALTLDQFLDQVPPVTVEELMAATPIVLAQTHALRQQVPEAAAAGEA